jgi:glycosyltransferase involved in cell wall biosynthesis
MGGRSDKGQVQVVINALSVRSGGGLVSLLELLPALRKADPGTDYTVVFSRSQRALIGELPAGVHARLIRADLSNVLLRLIVEQMVLPFVLWKLRADWLYSLGNQTVLLAPCRILLVMENTNPYSLHATEWTRGERVRLLILRVLGKLSCWRATKVRFLTRNSSDVLGGRLGVPESKRLVIPHGVRFPDGPMRATRDARIPGRYIFAAANVAPHKNLHTLMQGFDRFVLRSGYAGSLAIAGSVIAPGYAKSLDELRRGLSSADRIVLLGWVEPARLGTLYAEADMFVFPSIEETFGMPLLEAMAHGTAVVASKAPKSAGAHFIPFEEICGAAAVYFDPFDPDELASQLQRVASEPGLRERLIALGKERASEFSWAQTAQRLAQQFSSSERKS